MPVKKVLKHWTRTLKGKTVKQVITEGDRETPFAVSLEFTDGSYLYLATTISAPKQRTELRFVRDPNQDADKDKVEYMTSAVKGE